MSNYKTVLVSASVISALLFILVFGLAGMFHKPGNEPGESQGVSRAIVTFFPESLIITAEVADTETKRQTGLMFRERMDENDGMLFIFPEPTVQSFWMKNTLIPLDIIFISDELAVVKIQHALPCANDPCPLYGSEKPVKYVLEVNGNLTDTYGIEEGSKVDINV
ncbi:MAG TPA: DUF192 domain-containing protein [Candidatus Nanoarchaeia archaeon]|nr:DUF192 domain-containing protein [Candidatus Nanoarchaeia archaeon]